MHEPPRERDDDAATAALAASIAALDPQRVLALPAAADDAHAPWRDAEAYPRLLAIARDGRYPVAVRFLAAEFAFEQNFLGLPPQDFATLAEIYVQALRENLSGTMAHWGLEHDARDTGRLGSRLVHFGAAAVPAIEPLLEDRREVAYAYPSEFPSRLRIGLQIRDFAALYLAAILGLSAPPVSADGRIDDESREAFLRALRSRMP